MEKEIDKEGNKFYYQNGSLHRSDGPAIEWVNGTKFWYKHGKAHREDGPAFESIDGNNSWYLDGNYLSEEEFNKKISGKNEKID